MAAKDHLQSAQVNHHLFGERFRLLHGMTVPQALQGYGRINNRVVDPEEYAQARRVMFPKQQPWEEQVEETLANPSPPEDIVRRWARSHGELLVGTNPTAVARDVDVLTREMRGRGRSPEVPLYRGAGVAPEEQVEGRPDEPLSFTEDRYVATSFARGGGARGRIYRREPSNLRGIFVPDYVERERTVGQNRRPEREWLIDPQTLRDQRGR